MILNKVDPLIIFKIALTEPILDSFKEAFGFPEAGIEGDSIIRAIGGVPIPIYLSEQLSGILIDSVSNAIDIDTSIEGINKSTAMDVSQRVIDSTVTINMTCNNKDSLILAAIIAFMDIILRKAVSRAYTISYISGSTVILDGLLKSFTTNMNSDSEIVNINMVISKVNGKPDEVFPGVPKITGSVPIGNV